MFLTSIINAMVARASVTTDAGAQVPDRDTTAATRWHTSQASPSNLSSADAKTGDTIDFELLEDVTVDNLVVIARGATAIGTITEAEHKRRMARGGKLDIAIDYVRLVDDEKAVPPSSQGTKAATPVR